MCLPLITCTAFKRPHFKGIPRECYSFSRAFGRRSKGVGLRPLASNVEDVECSAAALIWNRLPDRTQGGSQDYMKPKLTNKNGIRYARTQNPQKATSKSHGRRKRCAIGSECYQLSSASGRINDKNL
jgi:hypothetical protein